MRWIGSSVLVLALGLGVLPAEAAVRQPTNVGFEQGLTGWTTSSPAAKVEAGGRTGQRLTHWAASAYDVSTRQSFAVNGLGWWTAAVWVKSGGSLAASRIALSGCGEGVSAVVPQTEQDDSWVRLAVSIRVTNGLAR